MREQAVVSGTSGARHMRPRRLVVALSVLVLQVLACLPPLQAAAFELPTSTPMLQVLVDDAAGMKGEQPSTNGSVYPLPKPISRVVQFSTMPIGHFNYAIGWGCMSAVMGYLALKVLRKGK